MPPSHKRGPWSQHEDQFLLHLVNTQGAHNWVRISQIIGSRSPKQCRERFHQNLKPTLNHEPITSEEGALIERLVNEMGKRWAEIARRLHGRSDNAVKNWWNGGMNRRKRLDVRRANAAPYHAEDYRDRNEDVHFSRPEPASVYGNYESRYPDPTERPQYAHGARHHPHINSIIHNARYSQRPVDAPLPSPSALSCMSRGESDCPPSLVSDGASSYTHSPRFHIPEPSTIELPPLGATRAESRRSSLPVLHLGTNQFVNDEQPHYPHFRHDEPKPSPLGPQSRPAQGPDYPRYHYMRDDALAQHGQLPLPDFRTLTAPGMLPESHSTTILRVHSQVFNVPTALPPLRSTTLLAEVRRAPLRLTTMVRPRGGEAYGGTRKDIAIGPPNHLEAAVLKSVEREEAEEQKEDIIGHTWPSNS